MSKSFYIFDGEENTGKVADLLEEDLNPRYLRVVLRTAQIYDAEVVSHSLRDKAYGWELTLNDRVFKFVSPENVEATV